MDETSVSKKTFGESLLWFFTSGRHAVGVYIGTIGIVERVMLNGCRSLIGLFQTDVLVHPLLSLLSPCSPRYS